MAHSLEREPGFIEAEQGMLPYGMGFKKPAHEPEIDPGSTASGLTNRPGYKTVAHMQRAWLGPT